MALYPYDLPLPDREPYGMSLDAGLVRTEFNTGAFRQRRQYRRLPTVLALQFTLRATELHYWQEWANSHGWAWFQIDLESGFGGGAILAPHEVRFIGDLDIASAGWNLVTITVAAELSPAMLAGTFVPVLPGAPHFVNKPNAVVADGGTFHFLPLVKNGRPPVAISVTGVPQGWTVDPATGEVTSPTLAQGNYGPITWRATDANGQVAVLGPYTIRAKSTLGWIVGQTPPNPSPDWIIAGTPAAPSADWTIPGTPDNPSVVV
jgi:hypothetical protein